MTQKPIHGHTFPVRLHLWALGGQWNRERDCWMVPEAHHAEALEIVNRQGPIAVNEAELIRQIRTLHCRLAFEGQADAGKVSASTLALRDAALRQEIACLESLLGRQLPRSSKPTQSCSRRC